MGGWKNTSSRVKTGPEVRKPKNKVNLASGLCNFPTSGLSDQRPMCTV
jgi:hypothetical protein